MSVIAKIITFKRLGIVNLCQVFIYRLFIKSGYFVKKLPIKMLNSKNEQLAFFESTSQHQTRNNDSFLPVKAFGWLVVDTNNLPDWHASVMTGKRVANNQQHWSTLNDFDLAVGDIKTVWELSRLQWTVIFAVNYKKSADARELQKLNTWLSDWCFHNPINQGVNWKCGQETAIRVMHLAACHYLVDPQAQLSKPLAELIYQHLLRISPTLHYAMAQDNNHGTSEAAALYIGGLLLRSRSEFCHCKQVKNWQKTGQYWLENRAAKLIDDDGCFSQNSVNYHRLMLDTLSLTEFFRQQWQQPEFSKHYYLKVRLCCYWLHNVTEPTSGKAALLGLNDGAQLLPITTSDYQDYRPSLQWAFQLFLGKTAYHQQVDCGQLQALFPCTALASNQDSAQINNKALNTSYHQVSNSVASCFIRTPDLKFRPSACDALHVDFWLGEDNLLVGTGSYSYNCEPYYQHYFPSVKSHSTVQFDNTEQMPNISRFLYNNWINTEVVQLNNGQLSAKYNNGQHQHQRQLTLTENCLEITDTLSGFNSSAVLRWQLANKQWQLNGNTLSAEKITITVCASEAINNIALAQGLMSRYYLQKQQIPMLQVTLTKPCIVTTTINWH